MFQHLPELFIILVLALIVFGPEKLPEVAGNAGKMVRQAREMLDEVMNPQDTEVADNFDTYYYESLARSGDDVPSPAGDIPLGHEGADLQPADVATEVGGIPIPAHPTYRPAAGSAPFGLDDESLTGRSPGSQTEGEPPAGKPL